MHASFLPFRPRLTSAQLLGVRECMCGELRVDAGEPCRTYSLIAPLVSVLLCTFEHPLLGCLLRAG